MCYDKFYFLSRYNRRVLYLRFYSARVRCVSRTRKSASTLKFWKGEAKLRPRARVNNSRHGVKNYSHFCGWMYRLLSSVMFIWSKAARDIILRFRVELQRQTNQSLRRVELLSRDIQNAYLSQFTICFQYCYTNIFIIIWSFQYGNESSGISMLVCE